MNFENNFKHAQVHNVFFVFVKIREINRENEEETKAEERETRSRRNLHRARRSSDADILLPEEDRISFDIIGKYVDWNKVSNFDSFQKFRL